MHDNSPLYTLKIHAELCGIHPDFSSIYKGSVLAIIIFATIENGRHNKICLTLVDRVGHLAPSALLYPCYDCYNKRENIVAMRENQLKCRSICHYEKLETTIITRFRCHI